MLSVLLKTFKNQYFFQTSKYQLFIEWAMKKLAKRNAFLKLKKM